MVSEGCKGEKAQCEKLTFPRGKGRQREVKHSYRLLLIKQWQCISASASINHEILGKSLAE